MLADDGLVLEVDRFDPGKVSSQDNQMLLPTATLPRRLRHLTDSG